MILLYGDESTFYRQPSQASLFAPRGRQQPPVHRSPRSDTAFRVGGFLDAVSGALHCWHAHKVTAEVVCKWLLCLAQAYPQATKIYVVLDNLPLHHHPRAMKAFGQDQRLKDLFLPTYSPWLNPIEKVWRRAKQIVAHAHPWCDDFAAFTQTILSHLADTSTQGEQLLKYVGLSPQ